MAQATQLCNWNDLAAEVTAGRMSWKGAAQAGTQDVTWAMFTGAVNNDGTNPAGIAATQCPTYNQMIARVSTLNPPSNVTAVVSGVHNITGSWGAPVGGLAPTSYDYQYFQEGDPFGAQGNTAGLAAPNVGGWTSGTRASISVRAKNGTNVGPWTSSPDVIVG